MLSMKATVRAKSPIENRGLPAEGLLGSARLTRSLCSGPPSLRDLVEPGLLNVAGSNFGRFAVERNFAVLGPLLRGMPAEGFE